MEEVRGFLSWTERPEDDEPARTPPSPHIPIPANAPEVPTPSHPLPDDSRPPQTLAEIRSAYNRLSRPQRTRFGPAIPPSQLAGPPLSPAVEPRLVHRAAPSAPLHQAQAPDDCPGLVTRPVLLLNLSQTGLLVLTDVAPSTTTDLWFCMADGSAIDWIKVSQKASEPTLRGFLLRLVFGEQCPYDLFKDVVLQNPSIRKP